jgi:hypothetical protein
VTTVDVSIKAPFTQKMLDQIAKSQTSAAQLHRRLEPGSLLHVGRTGRLRLARSLPHHQR